MHAKFSKMHIKFSNKVTAVNFIVTTERKSRESNLKLAREVSKKYLIEFRPRNQEPIEKMLESADGIFVAKKNSLRFYSSQGEIFFHPNLAHVRIKNLNLGLPDRMIEAMQLKPGMTVLDCTLGLGSDSIVASYVSKNRVIGLESSKVLSVIVKQGLHDFSNESTAIIEAMHRIEVVNQDHLEFLRSLPRKSFDVVYFDPMFRHPILTSQPMNALRSFTNPNALSEEVINLARNAARHRVVLKENSRSEEFNRLGFEMSMTGKYSSIAYGFIRIDS